MPEFIQEVMPGGFVKPLDFAHVCNCLDSSGLLALVCFVAPMRLSRSITESVLNSSSQPVAHNSPDPRGCISDILHIRYVYYDS